MSSHDEIAAFRESIAGLPLAMLTTHGDDGLPHARPMRVEELDDEGRLWFFTSASSDKAIEVATDARVSVTFTSADFSRFVSLSGVARLTRDREVMQRLWRPTYRAWYPGGLDDPELTLLRIDVVRAECWDVPSSTLVRAFHALKATVSGKQFEAGEHREVDLQTEPGTQNPAPGTRR